MALADPGYEYDAPRFYDFKREDDGVSMASRWFDGHEDDAPGQWHARGRGLVVGEGSRMHELTSSDRAWSRHALPFGRRAQRDEPGHV
jgi:hypothetical protein